MSADKTWKTNRPNPDGVTEHLLYVDGRWVGGIADRGDDDWWAYARDMNDPDRGYLLSEMVRTDELTATRRRIEQLLDV